MSWRIGIGNLLHHTRLATCHDQKHSSPRSVAAVVRQSLNDSFERNMFVDGPGSPILSIVTKCMRTIHLAGRKDICSRLLTYFETHPEQFQLTPVEKRFATLFRMLHVDEPQDLSTENRLRAAEAQYILAHDWDAALRAYLRASHGDRGNSSDHPGIPPELPLSLLRLWTLDDPRGRWRRSLHIIQQLAAKRPTPQNIACEKLLRACGPLGWEMWSVWNSTFPRFLRTGKDVESFALHSLPPWKDRWLMAFCAFDILISTKSAGRFNYERIDASQILWTKLGHLPHTPHLYALAAHRRALTHVDPLRLANAFRCQSVPLEATIRLFKDIRCPPEVISWILLQLVSMFHMKLHTLSFTTTLGADCTLGNILPEVKVMYGHDITFFLILTKRGLRMDGEPIFSFITRLFAGQTLTVDFGVITAQVPLRISADADQPSRCFVDATRAVILRDHLNVKRQSAYSQLSSYKRETSDEGRRVIQFTEKPRRFFQALPSETTLVKFIMPYYARVDHPMALNDALFDEQRTFELIAVDTHGDPSLHMYTVRFTSDDSHCFSVTQQMLDVRKHLAARSLAVLGDPDLGGPHMSSPLSEKPLICLGTQRFRCPRTGEKVIFEATTLVRQFWEDGRCGARGKPLELHIPHQRQWS